ncbi:unnamed protein product, partial [Mesorhabditis spiculigera]
MQTSAFEPDDMLRRGGILSSLINFKKKVPRFSQAFRQSSTEQAPCSSRTVQPNCPLPEQVLVQQQQEEQVRLPSIQLSSEERTPFDIYREIVSEVEHFERSSTATPLSEFAHSPTPLSPPGDMMQQGFQSGHQFGDFTHLLPPDHPSLDPNAWSNQTYQQCPFMQQVTSLDAPPAYPGIGTAPPSMPLTHFDYPTPPPQINNWPQLPMPMKMPLETKLINALQTQATMEEFVRLVVSAVKKEEDGSNEESPEEILRRKRNQNNAAAARYRKRQREAKMNAGDELQELVDKNSDLKSQVERMQLEIELLKRAVLNQNVSC